MATQPSPPQQEDCHNDDTTESERKKAGFRDLLSSDLRLTTLLSWFLMFYAAFSYYGVVLLSPGLIDGEVGLS